VSSTNDFFFTSDNYQAGFELLYISSEIDDYEQESTNINDKFWKAAAKFGKTSMRPRDDGSGGFYVDLGFTEFMSVRYLYDTKEITRDAATVLFWDFQWIIFGKKVYNRIVAREEVWTTRFLDDSLFLVDIKNKDRVDFQYERSVAFISR